MIDIVGVGMVVAGIAAIKLIELGIDKFFKKVDTDYVKEEDCEKRREKCEDCLHKMKDNQISLRSHDLPEKYVLKSDYNMENRNMRDWMAVIEAKLDRLIERGNKKS